MSGRVLPFEGSAHDEAQRLLPWLVNGRLEDRERAVVLLTFYAEKNAAEVCTELQLTAGNVRVIRHRAIERLRRCVTSRKEAE